MPRLFNTPITHRVVTIFALVFMSSLLITGLRFEPTSPLYTVLRFAIKEPVRALKQVVAFSIDIVQEVQAEDKEQEGAFLDNLLKKGDVTISEALAVLPEGQGTVTVVTQAAGQVVKVKVDRQKLATLTGQLTPSSRVQISFTINGQQYSSLIAKDMLLKALADG
jgi:hypothetical protein